MKVQKVISGGQTGVDQLALVIASSLGYQTGGYCPANCMTSSGPTKHLLEYGLEPLPVGTSLSAQYVRRSILNAKNSDATLAFLLYASVGTAKTVGYCLTGHWSTPELPQSSEDIAWTEYISSSHRPCFIVRSLNNPDATIEAIKLFLSDTTINVLNVCGHRDGKQLRSSKRRIKEILRAVLDNSDKEDKSLEELQEHDT